MDDYVSSGFFMLTLALINAGLAEQKNRSRWIWFLVSFLLGPLATALIVVWPAPNRVTPSVSRRGGTDVPV